MTTKVFYEFNQLFSFFPEFDVSIAASCDQEIGSEIKRGKILRLFAVPISNSNVKVNYLVTMM